MKKFLFLFLIFTFFLFCEDEVKNEKKKEFAVEEIIEKLDDVERRVDEIEKKIKTIEESIKNIEGKFNELRKTIRNFQIYVQPQATIKPTSDEWNSIKRGMTKEEVREILGSPEEVKLMRDKTEVWFYFGLGRIIFDINGEVMKIENDILTPSTRIR
ncbi:MAG: outer membrane protein assembly factor BamE [Candidatus Omnitrophica bacterium]|nr:outer membrane protein assembly factor BamE [Candidatus Omnitrophota bacterium]MCM8807210.1 outer membrane protein assembly factor BamE [Candidatus Omnitrophota bacterium]